MKKSEEGCAYSFDPIFKVIEFALQISFVTKAFANKMRLSLKKDSIFGLFSLLFEIIIVTEPPVLLGSGKASHSKL